MTFYPKITALTNKTPWTITSFYVDPSNSSGLASNSNSGLSALLPILTTQEFNKRIFLHDVQVASTIHYMSDENTATQLDLSTVSLTTGSLTFQGTPHILHTGGTLDAGTVTMDRTAASGGQRQIIHTSDLSDLTNYEYQNINGNAVHPVYLLDTTSGASSWVVTHATGGKASMSAPQGGVLTIGDSYTFQQGSLLSVLGHAMPPQENLGNFSGIIFNDFAFDLNHVGFPAASYNRCSFDTLLLVGGRYSNCYFVGISESQSGVGQNQGTGPISLFAGVFLSNGGVDAWSAQVTLGGDLYVTGPRLVFGTSFLANVNINSGIQIQDMNSFNGALEIRGDVNLVASIGPSGKIWGNGNLSAVGMLIGPGATAFLPIGPAPSVTGASGDFGFSVINAATVLQFARTWNEGTGTYSAPIVTSWANLYNAASLNYNAHDVGTNAHVVVSSSL
jgi:hypothetical protein